MHRIEEIKKFLRYNDYLPEVRQCGDGCIVTMPHPTLVMPKEPRIIEAYAVKRGEESGVYFNCTTNLKEGFLGVPEYGIRLLIQCGIAVSCIHVGVSPTIVSYYDGEGVEVKNITDIIGGPSDRSREGFLLTLFSEAQRDNFPAKYDQVAMTHNVAEGYRLCKSFLS